jgi:hypothetical protein
MPVAGCGAEEGENLGQESALARALPARVPPKLQGPPVRGVPDLRGDPDAGDPGADVAAAGVAQVDQRVAEAALAACPQLDFGTRHGIDRLCCPCRWIQAQWPPRRSGRHDVLPGDLLRQGRNRHHRRERTISALLKRSARLRASSAEACRSVNLARRSDHCAYPVRSLAGWAARSRAADESTYRWWPAGRHVLAGI